MSVIKDEYIGDRITKYDLLPLGFLNMSPYTGSKGGMRYRIEKKEEGEAPDIKKSLKVFVWKTPFSFDNTAETEMKSEEFEFSDEGIEKILEFLNKNYVL